MAAMFGGGRSTVISVSKTFPNSSMLPLRPNRLCVQFARKSSQANSDEADFGDVIQSKDARKAREASDEAVGSMKDYVKKAEEEAEKTKEKTKEEAGSMAERAKEKTKAAANAAREKASEAAEKTRETTREGIEKTKETAEAAKEKTAAAGERATGKAEEGAGKVAEVAQSIGEKAKQTVQGAWEAAKETTHKIKETVVGKDEEEAARDTLRDGGKAPPRDGAAEEARKQARD